MSNFSIGGGTRASCASQRRRLLQALASVPLMGLTGGQVAFAGGNNATSGQDRRPAGVVISACDDESGQHHASCMRYSGEERWRQPINERAHGATRHPHKPWALIFARRPGQEINVFDIESGERITRIKAAPDRHFYGHGVFSPDGGLLYATENAITRGEGRIGVYDANRDFARIGEFDSGGIGPHEIRLHPDGQQLIIANGGILTRPETGRVKLNLDTMQPNLTLLDRISGKVNWRDSPSHHQLSLRHLDVSRDGIIVAGYQYQGPPSDSRSLIVMKRPASTALEELPLPMDYVSQLKQYIASIAISPDGTLAVATAPRGNLITLWNLDTGELDSTLDFADCAGVLAVPTTNETPAGFVVSNGRGEWLLIDEDGLPALGPVRLANTHWDNHLALM
ncbi:DUF1513 domain-containing protein [Cobetia crustatorum]|uniref:DUF1513 domain-containing protein n=1 Tax=Cobetia crustatorum TaxID=553385 RepID=A0A558HLX1_9GAMM|nr:DUF1513 domain-containing protein [Cobetia crustatorum]TVU70051.1 DUF1513 domain-containing protein [Cobetia crustatorum]